MTLVRQINSRTSLFRRDDGKLVIAKTESGVDDTKIAARLELMRYLWKCGFPCASLLCVDGQDVVRDGENITYFQEYLEFPTSEQRDSFDKTLLSDSLALLIQFQSFSQSLNSVELAARFEPQFTGIIQKRLSEAHDTRNVAAETVLQWLAAQLNDIARLNLVPCHGSFRHHNLLYNRVGKLYVIDFFHGLDYAPRILDLCILMSHFPVASLLAMPRPSAFLTAPHRAFAWLSGAYRWGVYRKSLVQTIIDGYALSEVERHLLIPTVYLNLARSSWFHKVVTSYSMNTFIRVLGRILNSENCPPISLA